MNYPQIEERRLAEQDEREWIELGRLCRDKATRRKARADFRKRMEERGTLAQYAIDGERLLWDSSIMGSQCELYGGPDTSGARHVVYIFVDANRFIAYVGQTDQQLRHRIDGHLHKSLASKIYFIQASSETGGLNRLEYALIRTLQPYANKMLCVGSYVDPVRVLNKYGIDYMRSPLLMRRLNLHMEAA